MTMNLVKFMEIFQKHLRESGVTDETEIFSYMMELTELLNKHSMISKIDEN
jgi:hypothetical protein